MVNIADMLNLYKMLDNNMPTDDRLLKGWLLFIMFALFILILTVK